MSVRVKIPTPLRKLTDGQGEVEAAGANVRELLDSLEAKFPGLKERLCDEAGEMRRFVNVYVGEEDIRFMQGLDTSVGDESVVSIIPAVAGGGSGGSAERSEWRPGRVAVHERSERPPASTTMTRVEQDWGSIDWIVGADQGNSENMTFGRVRILGGRENPRHYHPNCDEVLHLLSGSLEHSLGDDVVMMSAGDTIVVPQGTVHNARAVGGSDAEMVVAFNSAYREFVLA